MPLFWEDLPKYKLEYECGMNMNMNVIFLNMNVIQSQL